MPRRPESWTWCRVSGAPFGKGTKLVVDARAEEKRQPFSRADYAAIFSTGVYRSGERLRGGSGEAAFWLPL